MSDDFLSRWSRRKRATGEEAAPEPVAAEPAAPVAPEPAAKEPAPEESDEEVLARLGLKHPDEMGPGDDFGAFLRAAVPRHLKTLAYRRLWRSNPTLACVDGLNDYDGDFTGTGVPAGGLKTAYQVGRGLMGRIAEVAENQRADVPPEAPDPDPPRAHGETEAEDVPEETAESAQSAEMVHEDGTPRRSRRRMVFRTTG